MQIIILKAALKSFFQQKPFKDFQIEVSYIPFVGWIHNLEVPLAVAHQTLVFP
jgi:hypothetical protein